MSKIITVQPKKNNLGQDKNMQDCSLKHDRPSDSVSVYVCVMEESVEEREERVTQQQSLFHGCTSQRAESCRVLRLQI